MITGEIGSDNVGLSLNNDKLLSTEVLGIGNIVVSFEYNRKL